MAVALASGQDFAKAFEALTVPGGLPTEELGVVDSLRLRLRLSRNRVALPARRSGQGAFQSGERQTGIRRARHSGDSRNSPNSRKPGRSRLDSSRRTRQLSRLSPGFHIEECEETKPGPKTGQ